MEQVETKVDVVAVLADYSAQHGDPEDFEQARAAIAELIEACQVYDDLRDRLFLLMMSDPRREGLLKQVDETDKRRRSALARVGGGK